MAVKALQSKVTQAKIAAVAGIAPVTIREAYLAMIPRVKELFSAVFSPALIALLPEYLTTRLFTSPFMEIIHSLIIDINPWWSSFFLKPTL